MNGNSDDHFRFGLLCFSTRPILAEAAADVCPLRDMYQSEHHPYFHCLFAVECYDSNYHACHFSSHEKSKRKTSVRRADFSGFRRRGQKDR